MRRKILLLLLFFTFSHVKILLGNSEQICIDDYSYKDGLTTSGVYSAFKDSRGFLWLCSVNGLYRFDGYNYRKLSTLVNGIADIETHCITEDADQNLWIGTAENGIFHYDTHTEKLTNVKLSLKCNYRIYKILFFRGKIWAATGNGLYMIAPDVTYRENTTLPVKILYPDPLHKTQQKNKINTIYAAPGSDLLWVGTNGSLYVLNTRQCAFEHINTKPQNAIMWISDYNHNLIVGSWDGGVFKINTRTKQVDNDALIANVNKVLRDKRIVSVFFDSKQKLWAATYGNGLYVFEHDTQSNIAYTNFRNDEKNLEGLKSDFINHMYLDNTGIVWLSMNQPALSKVYYEKSNLLFFDFPKKPNEKKPKEILSVYQSVEKDKLWIATNGQGIFLYNIFSHSYINFTNQYNSALKLIDNDVSFCYQDKDGNLWLVFRHFGLFIVPAADARRLVSSQPQTPIIPIDANTLLTNDRNQNLYITQFYEDHRGRVWIGTWSSLYVVATNKGFAHAKDTSHLKSESVVTCVYADQNPTNSVPISPIFSILEKGEHQYWLGTRNAGILQLAETEENKFSFARLSINDKLPNNNIRCFKKDSRHAIWIGTSSGLCYWNESTNTFKTITEKDGLASENINNIIEDKDTNIWVSTSYGISEIHSRDFSIRNHFFTDKEKFNHYILNAALLTDDGRIYFSSSDALVTMHPNAMEAETNNAPLYFTDIKIDNKTVNPFEVYNGTQVIDASINECKSVNVPYNHTLSIEFAALEYSNPQRVLYKYKLGRNADWVLIHANQRNISLAGMKPGAYSFIIMLANTTKANNVRTLQINYLPPYWQSKPALVLYFIILLLIFLTYRKLAIQKVVQKAIIEQERYERKKLQELDKMKSEFFSNISHEFRTPLTLIINPLEKLAKNDELSEKSKTGINLILKSSSRLLKLTNEMMDFSKIENKLLKPEFQLCDIVTFVADISELFNNLAHSTNIDFRFGASFDLLEIPIDKGMIEKVIFNLLSNAFKYTPNNGVILVHIAKDHIAERECVKISIMNTGEGIAKDNLDKVFDRYFQVNNIQNRKVEGTGIGLSLVKSYVEFHNGTASVKSEPNVETCFDVHLPLTQEHFDATLENNTKETGLPVLDVNAHSGIGMDVKRPASHYQVLLVEDDDDIRNYIKDQLSADFTITTAKDGNEGIQHANETIPDLIITDVVMPGISGIALCKNLKNQLTTSHIPIIILSAKTTVEHQIEGLEMGADVYMIKPFHVEHLKTQIVRLIRFKETVYSRFLKETTLVPQGAISTKLDEEFVNKIIAFIETNLSDTELNIGQLANCVTLSKVQVYRKLKAISGQTIVEFIRTIRLKKAAQMVLEKRLSFTEIAFETGFSSPSYFTRCFHDHFGKTPSEFASDYGHK